MEANGFSDVVEDAGTDVDDEEVLHLLASD
jgi:hypothetical protein